MTLSPTDLHGLRSQLLRFEGLRLKPYTDTQGKLTIGVGRNLTDKGITRDEALSLFEGDLSDAMWDLQHACPWAATLDPIRQRVLIDLTFNMGITTVLTFRKMIAAILTDRWADAADALLDSAYHRQVGQRAEILAAMLKDGTIPSEAQFV